MQQQFQEMKSVPYWDDAHFILKIPQTENSKWFKKLLNKFFKEFGLTLTVGIRAYFHRLSVRKLQLYHRKTWVIYKTNKSLKYINPNKNHARFIKPDNYTPLTKDSHLFNGSSSNTRYSIIPSEKKDTKIKLIIYTQNL